MIERKLKQACTQSRQRHDGAMLDSSAKSHVHLTRIQKLIGRRMLESKQKKPCFYIGLKTDVTELMGMRSKLRKSLAVKVTTNAFYIRALALAAREYPLMVGTIENDNIRIADGVNVGFAVNTPQGLLVPVIKHADKKTLSEIAAQEKILTEKGRSNRLTLQEMEGETIALSNLGSYGIDSFLGIVPPPTSTILAVGNVIPMALPRDGNVVTRKMVGLTLAVDRRVIDEVYAAQFLSYIKERLQTPQELV